MHDIYEESVEYITKLLEYLQAEGYEFVTVDELMQDNFIKNQIMHILTVLIFKNRLRSLQFYWK